MPFIDNLLPFHPCKENRAAMQGKYTQALKLHDILDQDAGLGLINTHSFEMRLSQITRSLGQDGYIYANCLNRLMELALFQAGSQADQAECDTASSLLFRPALVLIHQKGKTAPIIKDPNLPLTSQFKEKGGNSLEVINWLKRNTFVEVRTQPFLPRIYQLLKETNLISPDELKKLHKNMDQLACTITFMDSLRLPQGMVFSKWLQDRPEPEKKALTKKLCSFDLDYFFELGELARNTLDDPGKAFSSLDLPLPQEDRTKVFTPYAVND